MELAYEMRDFIKPILRGNPDKLVFHVRTNDLRHNEPKAVADGIANLVLKIEQQCSNVQGLHLNPSGSAVLQNNYKLGQWRSQRR